jgi:hypothetical protein
LIIIIIITPTSHQLSSHSVFWAESQSHKTQKKGMGLVIMANPISWDVDMDNGTLSMQENQRRFGNYLYN